MGIFRTAPARIVALAAVMGLLAGCARDDWGYLSGTVQLNGEPVGPGSIMLEPVDGLHAGAVGAFGEDGKYTIQSAGRKEGARTGEYNVTIHGPGFTEEGAGSPPASKIPARYGNPSTSGLKVTIEPGNKTVDFDLEP